MGALKHPLMECPECDGEGRVEYSGGPGYYDTYLGGWLPSDTVEECSACGGSGERDRQWTMADDELPPVGEKVLVIGYDDGAPDRVAIVTEDELLDEGDVWERRPPTWKHCVLVSEWASL